MFGRNKFAKKKQIKAEDEAHIGRNNTISVATSNRNVPHQSSRTLSSSKTQSSRPRKQGKDLTKIDLEQYYDIRQQDAASHLGLSLSTLKRACRRLKIPQWPFKKNKSKLLLKHGEIDDSHESIAKLMVIDEELCMHTPSTASEYCYTERSGVSSNEGAVSGYNMNFMPMANDNLDNATAYIHNNADWNHKQRSQSFANVEYSAYTYLPVDNRDRSCSFTCFQQVLGNREASCELYPTINANSATTKQNRLHLPCPSRMNSNQGRSLSYVSNGIYTSQVHSNSNASMIPYMNQDLVYSDDSSIYANTEISEQSIMRENLPHMGQQKQRSQSFANVEYLAHTYPPVDNRDRSCSFTYFQQVLAKKNADCKQYPTTNTQTPAEEQSQLYTRYQVRRDSNRVRSSSNVSNRPYANRMRSNSNASGMSRMNRSRF